MNLRFIAREGLVIGFLLSSCLITGEDGAERPLKGFFLEDASSVGEDAGDEVRSRGEGTAVGPRWSVLSRSISSSSLA
jgi:hypothetical protein